MDKWILQHKIDPAQVLFFSRLIDLAVSSDSYEQLCQRVVHEEITQGLISGAHLYSVDSNLDMELQVSHGKTTSLVEQVVSAWGTSPLSKCLVEKKMQYEEGKEAAHVALPLAKSSVPVGALLLVMRPEVASPPISEPVAHLLSKIGAFFVEVRPRNSPQARVTGKGHSHSPGQLTTRQIQIVQLIGAGLTNGQIGKDLALSESSIRQETIKIYRALGVSGRDEAVSAAQKMGLVSINL
jgi:ATP/maltotriose-dependent transcriptional regulator MalT